MKNWIDKINKKDFWTKLLFPFIGLAALIWFLIRVIPKPSRASYPCMQVAAPLASSFVMYMLGIIGSITAFRIAKIKFKDARYLSGVVAVIAFFIFSSIYLFNSAVPAKAKVMEDFPANIVNGEGRGIFPGRVVWSWNPDATNENCDGTYDGDGVITADDNIYYAPKNNNETVIKEMLSETMLTLTGTSDLSVAWDSVFTYFNRTIRSELHGYQTGEKIFIKTNNQGIGLLDNMNADLSQREGYVWGNPIYEQDMAATSPYTTLAILDQLVNIAGIPQDVIYVGDPHLNFNKVYYDIFSAEFPDVHYMGVNGSGWQQMKDCEAYGRTLSVPTEDNVIFYSDRDIIDDPGTDSTNVKDKIYQQMYDADYMINIAALKGHVRAGITLLAKSHFGSHTEDGAWHLHRGLVQPDGENPDNVGYGKYRVLVDLLGHEHLGGKTILNIIDGLWGGNYNEGYKPRKWDMAPFNGDYSSSIIASIDPIAASSVAHDFLRTEYNVTDWGEENATPNILGTDDYLLQAADPSLWPEGFTYDPENDGTPLKSLGVHEHWNNASDMQYTRDLGGEDGIELVKLLTTVFVNNPILDLNAEKNTADTTIDLAPVFNSPFNDSIELSILNQSNPALLTATIEDSTLMLSFTKDMIGTDTIIVQATAAGKSATDQFVVTVNPALFLDNPISDLTVASNAADKIIDLSEVFYEINGASVIYSVINQTNPGLVATGIQDSILTLDFNEGLTGKDTITVQAAVPGEILTDKFVVTVDPATDISVQKDAVPQKYSLSQNYPNPFNPETTIRFALPEAAQVRIAIYDINGRHIKDILNGNETAGYHSVKWNASDLASGLYVYQIRTRNFTQVKKCLLVK